MNHHTILRVLFLAIVAIALLGVSVIQAEDYEITYVNTMLWSQANSVTASGNYAFATTGFGVTSIDISDPALPVIRTKFDMGGGNTTNIKVDGSHLFVANGYNGLAILDISSSPVLNYASETDGIGNIVDVVVSGNYAYLASTDSGIVILDITDRTDPILVTCISDSNGFDIISIEDTVVAAARSGFVMLLNIADPLSPVIASTISPTGGMTGMFIKNSSVITSGDIIVNSYDISDLANPSSGIMNFIVDIITMTEIGDYALVITASETFIINVTNPLSLSEDGHVNFNADYGGNITVAGDLAFYTDNSGIEILDVTNPLTPSIVSTIAMIEYYDQGKLFGNELIVTDYSSNIIVIDVSNPQTATVLYVDTNYAVRSIERSDSILAVGYVDGLKILNFTDPASPIEIGEITFTGTTNCITIVGNYLYAGIYNKLVIYDITDRTAPVELGSLTETNYSPQEILIDGNTAYIANSTNRGFDIVDITDKTNPTGLGTTNPPGYSNRLANSGDYIFLSGGFSGLQTIDVSNPASPTVVNTWYDGNAVFEVTIVDTVAYVGTSLGLQLLNIKDPLNPVSLGNYATPEEPRSISVDGDNVYIVEHGGLCFVEAVSPAPMSIDDNAINLLPGQMSLQQNYPNPFNPSTTIKYSLSQRSNVTISIFNSLGQKVKSLFEGVKTVGDYQINWDGRSDHGNRLASGIYYYRLKTENLVESKKMVLIK